MRTSTIILLGASALALGTGGYFLFMRRPAYQPASAPSAPIIGPTPVRRTYEGATVRTHPRVSPTLGAPPPQTQSSGSGISAGSVGAFAGSLVGGSTGAAVGRVTGQVAGKVFSTLGGLF